MKRNTVLETLTALAFLAFIGVFLYYAFYPFKVTTLNSIGIDKEEYCRGDWVKVEMDFTKHMDIQAEVKWFIVDGIVYQLDSPGISRPEGSNKITVSKQVPHSILPGVYHLRVEMKYNIHPLHNPIITGWDTPKFNVKKESECPNELNMGENDPNKPVPSPTPVLIPILYSAYADDGSNKDKIIVVPERNNNPIGEPQEVQTPEPQPEKKGLIQNIVKTVKKIFE